MPSWHAARLKKHRDNCTFTFYLITVEDTDLQETNLDTDM